MNAAIQAAGGSMSVQENNACTLAYNRLFGRSVHLLPETEQNPGHSGDKKNEGNNTTHQPKLEDIHMPEHTETTTSKAANNARIAQLEAELGGGGSPPRRPWSSTWPPSRTTCTVWPRRSRRRRPPSTTASRLPRSPAASSWASAPGSPSRPAWSTCSSSRCDNRLTNRRSATRKGRRFFLSPSVQSPPLNGG